VQNDFIDQDLNIKNYKISVVTKPKPIFKIVDNGNKVLTKENVEELVVEPIYYNSIDTGNNKQGYALLTPDEFSSMTDEEIKDWYNKTKTKL
jgi:hypothetical protein